MPNVLVLTTVLPRQQRMGSEVASQCFIDALAAIGCNVTVAGYMRKDDPFETLPQEIVVGKRYIETKKSKLNTMIWLSLSFLLGWPYSAAKYQSKAYRGCLYECLATTPFDLVVVDHPQLGWLHRFAQRTMPKREYKVVAIAHNIEHEIYQSNAEGAQNFLARWIYQREARLIKTSEDDLAIQVDQVWTLTDHDATYFNRRSPLIRARAFALPPGMAAEPPAEAPSKTFDIGLIGSWAWKPNEEGLRWFLQEVYPLLPDHFTIQVAGRGADWLAEQYPNITYVGFVPSAQLFMAQARVVAIPTLSGGGIQIKTLDAIASGSKIVATPVAIRGISEPPSTLHVAKTASEFAKQLALSVTSTSNKTNSSEASTWLATRQAKFTAELSQSLETLLGKH